jgi:SOS-response transcriptional repressor LexA
MKRSSPKIPPEVYQKIKSAAQKLAFDMGYLNASIPMRSTIIDSLVSHEEVGKVLANYLDKTRLRSHIKDNILRALSQQQFKPYPIEEHIKWCNAHYGVNSLIVVDRECSSQRRSVYWLKDEETKFSVFVAECAYKCWESALRAALLFIAKNKVGPDARFKILLSLSPGQSVVPDREEQFLRYALSAVNVDMRIVRLSDLAALESAGVLHRLWAEGEFPWEERFAKYLPVYGFAAACGKFGAGEEVACAGWMDVTDAGLGRLGRNENLFVVQAKGHSMEPKIRDGQFCVFEHRKGEFHDNDIVLAQHAPNIDTETEGAFSIKKIEKRGDQIVLRPVNAAYDPITLPASSLGGDYKIIGTLRGVVNEV